MSRFDFSFIILSAANFAKYSFSNFLSSTISFVFNVLYIKNSTPRICFYTYCSRFVDKLYSKHITQLSPIYILPHLLRGSPIGEDSRTLTLAVFLLYKLKYSRCLRSIKAPEHILVFIIITFSCFVVLLFVPLLTCMILLPFELIYYM